MDTALGKFVEASRPPTTSRDDARYRKARNDEEGIDADIAAGKAEQVGTKDDHGQDATARRPSMSGR